VTTYSWITELPFEQATGWTTEYSWFDFRQK